MEFILVLFIASFVYRAIPNVDMLPSLPASENQLDDQEWGKITRMEFMATHPPASTLPPKVRPEKTWLQKPKVILV
jgi:hypothetical protein